MDSVTPAVMWFLKLRERDHHVGIRVGMIQVQRGKHVSAGGNGHVSVRFAEAEVAGVLELHFARAMERFDVPIRQVKRGASNVAVLWVDSTNRTRLAPALKKRGSRANAVSNESCKSRPTGRSRNGWKSVPVRFSLTVTVLSFTSEPIPPRGRSTCPAPANLAPYERHWTIATLHCGQDC